MNIEQLLKSGNVTLAINASDLHEFALALINEVASMNKGEKEEIMLSADECCKVLNISSNSLWRWGKTGYLCGRKIGRKVYYRKSDIDRLLTGKEE